jgi:hypothetical protein
MNNIFNNIIDAMKSDIVSSKTTSLQEYLFTLKRYTDVESVETYIQSITDRHKNASGIKVNIMYTTYDVHADEFIFHRVTIGKLGAEWAVEETNTEVKWIKVPNTFEYTLQYPINNISGEKLLTKLPVILRTDI